MSNVKVAVRARPLDKRELNKNARIILEPHGDSVSVHNIKLEGHLDIGDNRERVKTFTFDHVYWSVDPQCSNQASQETVFSDLGLDVLQSAFEGYNACVFAYGQTGSGKTHTMMGYPDCAGLIPRICEGLFRRMTEVSEEEEDERVSYRIAVSYLEIYNERVRDLLRPVDAAQPAKHKLKVREHPKEGPYVQDLSQHIVKNNQAVQELIGRGNECRTTAVTHMHEQSSRSHAIFTVTFTQVCFGLFHSLCADAKLGITVNVREVIGIKYSVELIEVLSPEYSGKPKSISYLLVPCRHSSPGHQQAKLHQDIPRETISKINLVDLAGSERADPTSQYHKGRLKEGANINKSLVTLGSVIQALAKNAIRQARAERSLLQWSCESLTTSATSPNEKRPSSPAPSSPKRRQLFIPYRDSILTWLLKDSLGGNAKTIMVATVSPSSLQYNETISTLRYAQRAKCIINKPTVNEDQNVTLIRELRAEIVRLRTMLNSHYAGSNASLSETSSYIAERLEENENMAMELTRNWCQKWPETQELLKESDMSIRPLSQSRRSCSMGVIVDSLLPHLVAMDDDILSTGIIMYHLKEGKTTAGTEEAATEPDIVLSGLGVIPDHCTFQNVNGEVTLHPSPGSEISINSEDTFEPTKLTQGDMVCLGHCNIFRFNHPEEAAKLREHRRTLYGDGRLPGALSRCSSMNSLLSAASAPDLDSLPTTPLLPRTPSWNEFCYEMEVPEKPDSEKLNGAKYELARLQAEQESCMDQEDDMWRVHTSHRMQIVEQRRLVEAMIREFEKSRNDAEKELEEARRKLEEEKAANQRLLEAEMGKLRELERTLMQQRHLQENGAGVDSEDNVSFASVGSESSSIAGFAEVYGAELSHLQAVVEEQRQKLVQMEESQRRSEDNLLQKQYAFEEQFLASTEKVSQQRQMLAELEDSYRSEDLSSLDSVSSNSDWLERLESRQAKLMRYIEIKEHELQSDAERVDPIGESGSDESLTSSKGYMRHGKGLLHHKRAGSDSGSYSYLMHHSAPVLHASDPKGSTLPAKMAKPPRHASPSQSPSPAPSNAKSSPKVKQSLLAEQVTARLYKSPPAKAPSESQGGARKKIQYSPSRPPDLPLGPGHSQQSSKSSRLLNQGGGMVPSSPSLRLSSSSLTSVPESFDESLPDSDQMDYSESWPLQSPQQTYESLNRLRTVSCPSPQTVPTIKIERAPTRIVPYRPPVLGPNRPKGAIESLMQQLPLKKKQQTIKSVKNSESETSSDNVFDEPNNAKSRTSSADPGMRKADPDSSQTSIPSQKVSPDPGTEADLEAGSSAAASKPTFHKEGASSKPQRPSSASPSTPKSSNKATAGGLHRPTLASLAKQSPTHTYVSPSRRSPSSPGRSPSVPRRRGSSSDSRSSSTHSQDRRNSSDDITSARGRGLTRRGSDGKSDGKRPGSAPPHGSSPLQSPRIQRSTSRESVKSERSLSHGSIKSECSTSRESVKSRHSIPRDSATMKATADTSNDASKQKATKRPVKPSSPLTRPKKRTKDSDIPVEIYLPSKLPAATEGKEGIPHSEQSHEIFAQSLRGGVEDSGRTMVAEEVFQTEDGTKVIMRTRLSGDTENQRESLRSSSGSDMSLAVRRIDGGEEYEVKCDGTLEALPGVELEEESAEEGPGHMDYSCDSLDEGILEESNQDAEAVAAAVDLTDSHHTVGSGRDRQLDRISDSIANNDHIMSCDSLEAPVFQNQKHAGSLSTALIGQGHTPSAGRSHSSHDGEKVTEMNHNLQDHPSSGGSRSGQQRSQTQEPMDGGVVEGEEGFPKADEMHSTSSPSVNRKSLRQRTLRRAPLAAVDTESDQAGTMSDDSLASDTKSRLGSRPTSAAKRRRRQPRPASSTGSKRAKTYSSEEYQSTDNDSNFSEDSLAGFDEEYVVDEDAIACELTPEQLSEMTETVQAITSHLTGDVLSTITESVQAMTTELLNDNEELASGTCNVDMCSDVVYIDAEADTAVKQVPNTCDNSNAIYAAHADPASRVTQDPNCDNMPRTRDIQQGSRFADRQSRQKLREGSGSTRLGTTTTDVWSTNLDEIFGDTESKQRASCEFSDTSSSDMNLSLQLSQSSLSDLLGSVPSVSDDSQATPRKDGEALGPYLRRNLFKTPVDLWQSSEADSTGQAESLTYESETEIPHAVLTTSEGLNEPKDQEELVFSETDHTWDTQSSGSDLMMTPRMMENLMTDKPHEPIHGNIHLLKHKAGTDDVNQVEGIKSTSPGNAFTSHRDQESHGTLETDNTKHLGTSAADPETNCTATELPITELRDIQFIDDPEVVTLPKSSSEESDRQKASKYERNQDFQEDSEQLEKEKSDLLEKSDMHQKLDRQEDSEQLVKAKSGNQEQSESGGRFGIQEGPVTDVQFDPDVHSAKQGNSELLKNSERHMMSKFSQEEPDVDEVERSKEFLEQYEKESLKVEESDPIDPSSKTWDVPGVDPSCLSTSPRAHLDGQAADNVPMEDIAMETAETDETSSQYLCSPDISITEADDLEPENNNEQNDDHLPIILLPDGQSTIRIHSPGWDNSSESTVSIETVVHITPRGSFSASCAGSNENINKPETLEEIQESETPVEQADTMIMDSDMEMQAENQSPEEGRMFTTQISEDTHKTDHMLLVSEDTDHQCFDDQLAQDEVDDAELLKHEMKLNLPLDTDCQQSDELEALMDSDRPSAPHVYSSDDGFISGEGALSPPDRTRLEEEPLSEEQDSSSDAAENSLAVAESVISKLQESYDSNKPELSEKPVTEDSTDRMMLDKVSPVVHSIDVDITAGHVAEMESELPQKSVSGESTDKMLDNITSEVHSKGAVLVAGHVMATEPTLPIHELDPAPLKGVPDTPEDLAVDSQASQSQGPRNRDSGYYSLTGGTSTGSILFSSTGSAALSETSETSGSELEDSAITEDTVVSSHSFKRFDSQDSTMLDVFEEDPEIQCHTDSTEISANITDKATRGSGGSDLRIQPTSGSSFEDTDTYVEETDADVKEAKHSLSAEKEIQMDMSKPSVSEDGIEIIDCVKPTIPSDSDGESVDTTGEEGAFAGRGRLGSSERLDSGIFDSRDPESQLADTGDLISPYSSSQGSMQEDLEEHEGETTLVEQKDTSHSSSSQMESSENEYRPCPLEEGSDITEPADDVMVECTQIPVAESMDHEDIQEKNQLPNIIVSESKQDQEIPAVLNENYSLESRTSTDSKDGITTHPIEISSEDVVSDKGDSMATHSVETSTEDRMGEISTEDALPGEISTEDGMPGTGEISTEDGMPDKEEKSTEDALPGEISIEDAMPGTGEISTENGMPDKEEISTEDALPDEGEIFTEDALPDEGEIFTEDALPDEGEISAEDALPDEGEISAEDALPDQEEISTEDAMPDEGKISSEDALPDQGEISTEDAMPGIGEISTEDVLPDEGEISTEDALPDEGEMSTEDALPDEGEISTEDALLDEKKKSTEDAMPDEGEISTEDALPDEGKIASEDGMPVRGDKSSEDGIPDIGEISTYDGMYDKGQEPVELSTEDKVLESHLVESFTVGTLPGHEASSDYSSGTPAKNQDIHDPSLSADPSAISLPTGHNAPHVIGDQEVLPASPLLESGLAIYANMAPEHTENIDLPVVMCAQESVSGEAKLLGENDDHNESCSELVAGGRLGETGNQITGSGSPPATLQTAGDSPVGLHTATSADPVALHHSPDQVSVPCVQETTQSDNGDILNINNTENFICVDTQQTVGEDVQSSDSSVDSNNCMTPVSGDHSRSESVLSSDADDTSDSSIPVKTEGQDLPVDTRSDNDNTSDEDTVAAEVTEGAHKPDATYADSEQQQHYSPDQSHKDIVHDSPKGVYDTGIAAESEFCMNNRLLMQSEQVDIVSRDEQVSGHEAECSGTESEPQAPQYSPQNANKGDSDLAVESLDLTHDESSATSDPATTKLLEGAAAEAETSWDEGYVTLLPPSHDVSKDGEDVIEEEKTIDTQVEEPELRDNGVMLLSDLATDIQEPEPGAAELQCHDERSGNTEIGEDLDVSQNTIDEEIDPNLSLATMSEAMSRSPRFQSSPVPYPEPSTGPPHRQDLQFSEMHIRTIADGTSDGTEGPADSGHFQVVHFKAPSPQMKRKKSQQSQERSQLELEQLAPSPTVTIEKEDFVELASSIPQGSTYIMERSDGRRIQLGDWEDAGTVVDPPFKESYYNPRPLDDRYYMQEVGGFDALRCLIESGEMEEQDLNPEFTSQNEEEMMQSDEMNNDIEEDQSDSSSSEEEDASEIIFEYERPVLPTIDENTVLETPVEDAVVGTGSYLNDLFLLKADLENVLNTEPADKEVEDRENAGLKESAMNHDKDDESMVCEDEDEDVDLDSIRDRLDCWRSVKDGQLSHHRDSITSLGVQVGDQGAMEEVMSDAEPGSDDEEMCDMEEYILNPDTMVSHGQDNVPERQQMDDDMTNKPITIKQDHYGSMIVNIGETESLQAVSDDEQVQDADSSEDEGEEEPTKYEMETDKDSTDMWQEVKKSLDGKRPVIRHQESSMSMAVNVGELETDDVISEADIAQDDEHRQSLESGDRRYKLGHHQESSASMAVNVDEMETPDSLSEPDATVDGTSYQQELEDVPEVNEVMEGDSRETWSDVQEVLKERYGLGHHEASMASMAVNVDELETPDAISEEDTEYINGAVSGYQNDIDDDLFQEARIEFGAEQKSAQSGEVLLEDIMLSRPRFRTSTESTLDTYNTAEGSTSNIADDSLFPLDDSQSTFIDNHEQLGMEHVLIEEPELHGVTVTPSEMEQPVLEDSDLEMNPGMQVGRRGMLGYHPESNASITVNVDELETLDSLSEPDGTFEGASYQQELEDVPEVSEVMEGDSQETWSDVQEVLKEKHRLGHHEASMASMAVNVDELETPDAISELGEEDTDELAANVILEGDSEERWSEVLEVVRGKHMTRDDPDGPKEDITIGSSSSVGVKQSVSEQSKLPHMQGRPAMEEARDDQKENRSSVESINHAGEHSEIESIREQIENISSEPHIVGSFELAADEVLLVEQREEEGIHIKSKIVSPVNSPREQQYANLQELEAAAHVDSSETAQHVTHLVLAPANKSDSEESSAQAESSATSQVVEVPRRGSRRGRQANVEFKDTQVMGFDIPSSYTSGSEQFMEQTKPPEDLGQQVIMNTRATIDATPSQRGLVETDIQVLGLQPRPWIPDRTDEEPDVVFSEDPEAPCQQHLRHASLNIDVNPWRVTTPKSDPSSNLKEEYIKRKSSETVTDKTSRSSSNVSHKVQQNTTSETLTSGATATVNQQEQGQDLSGSQNVRQQDSGNRPAPHRKNWKTETQMHTGGQLTYSTSKSVVSGDKPPRTRPVRSAERSMYVTTVESDTEEESHGNTRILKSSEISHSETRTMERQSRNVIDGNMSHLESCIIPHDQNAPSAADGNHSDNHSMSLDLERTLQFGNRLENLTTLNPDDFKGNEGNPALSGRLSPGEIYPDLLSTTQLVSEVIEAERELLAQDDEGDGYPQNADGSFSSSSQDQLHGTGDTSELLEDVAAAIAAADAGEDLMEAQLDMSNLNELPDMYLTESALSRSAWMRKLRPLAHRSVSMSDVDHVDKHDWYEGRSLSVDCLLWPTDVNMGGRTTSGDSITYVFMPHAHSYDAMVDRSMEEKPSPRNSSAPEFGCHTNSRENTATVRQSSSVTEHLSGNLVKQYSDKDESKDYMADTSGNEKPKKSVSFADLSDATDSTESNQTSSTMSGQQTNMSIAHTAHMRTQTGYHLKFVAAEETLVLDSPNTTQPIPENRRTSTQSTSVQDYDSSSLSTSESNQLLSESVFYDLVDRDQQTEDNSKIDVGIQAHDSQLNLDGALAIQADVKEAGQKSLVGKAVPREPVHVQSTTIQTEDMGTFDDTHHVSHVANPVVNAALADLNHVLEAQQAIMQATEIHRRTLEQWQQIAVSAEPKVIWKHAVTLSTQTGSSLEGSEASDGEEEISSSDLQSDTIRSIETQTSPSVRLTETQTSETYRVVETQTEVELTGDLPNEQADETEAVGAAWKKNESVAPQTWRSGERQKTPTGETVSSCSDAQSQLQHEVMPSEVENDPEADSVPEVTSKAVEFTISTQEIWSTPEDTCTETNTQNPVSTQAAVEAIHPRSTNEVAIQNSLSMEELNDLGISTADVEAFELSDSDIDSADEYTKENYGPLEGATHYNLKSPQLDELKEEHERLMELVRKSKEDRDERKQHRKDMVQNRTTLLMGMMNSAPVADRETNVSPSDSGLSALSPGSLSTITAVPATPSLTETASLTSDTDSVPVEAGDPTPVSVALGEAQHVAPTQKSSLPSSTDPNWKETDMQDDNQTTAEKKCLVIKENINNDGKISRGQDTLDQSLSSIASSQDLHTSDEDIIEAHITAKQKSEKDMLESLVQQTRPQGDEAQSSQRQPSPSKQTEGPLGHSDEQHTLNYWHRLQPTPGLEADESEDEAYVVEEVLETAAARRPVAPDNLVEILEGTTDMELVAEPELASSPQPTQIQARWSPPQVTTVEFHSVENHENDPPVRDTDDIPESVSVQAHPQRTPEALAQHGGSRIAAGAAENVSNVGFQPYMPMTPPNEGQAAVYDVAVPAGLKRSVVVLQSNGEQRAPIQTLSGSSLAHETVAGSSSPARPSSCTIATQYEEDLVSPTAQQVVNAGNTIHLTSHHHYNLLQPSHSGEGLGRTSPAMSETKDESIGTDLPMSGEYDDELERLRRERERILAMLAKDVMPSKLQVELAEAQLNYIIGQTDTLLSTLDDKWDWDSAQLMQMSDGQEQLTQISREYIEHYRSTLEESRVQIESRIQHLEKDRERTKRSRDRQRQIASFKREAQVRAFQLEREREQTNYEHIKSMPRSRSDSPAIRSQITTERQRTTSESSNSSSVYVEPEPLSAHFLTPKQRKQHLIGLRKGLLSSNSDLRVASPGPSESGVSNRSFSPVFTYSTYSVYTPVSTLNEPAAQEQASEPLAPGYTLYSTAIPPTDAARPHTPRQHLRSSSAPGSARRDTVSPAHSLPSTDRRDELNDATGVSSSLDQASQRLLSEYQVARGRAEMEIQRARQTLETRRAARTSPYQQIALPRFEVANIREDIKSTRATERQGLSPTSKQDRKRIDDLRPECAAPERLTSNGFSNESPSTTNPDSLVAQGSRPSEQLSDFCTVLSVEKQETERDTSAINSKWRDLYRSELNSHGSPSLRETSSKYHVNGYRPASSAGTYNGLTGFSSGRDLSIPYSNASMFIPIKDYSPSNRDTYATSNGSKLSHEGHRSSRPYSLYAGSTGGLSKSDILAKHSRAFSEPGGTSRSARSLANGFTSTERNCYTSPRSRTATNGYTSVDSVKGHTMTSTSGTYYNDYMNSHATGCHSAHSAGRHSKDCTHCSVLETITNRYPSSAGSIDDYYGTGRRNPQDQTSLFDNTSPPNNDHSPFIYERSPMSEYLSFLYNSNPRMKNMSPGTPGSSPLSSGFSPVSEGLSSINSTSPPSKISSPRAADTGSLSNRYNPVSGDISSMSKTRTMTNGHSSVLDGAGSSSNGHLSKSGYVSSLSKSHPTTNGHSTALNGFSAPRIHWLSEAVVDSEAELSDKEDVMDEIDHEIERLKKKYGLLNLMSQSPTPKPESTSGHGESTGGAVGGLVGATAAPSSVYQRVPITAHQSTRLESEMGASRDTSRSKTTTSLRETMSRYSRGSALDETRDAYHLPTRGGSYSSSRYSSTLSRDTYLSDMQRFLPSTRGSGAHTNITSPERYSRPISAAEIKARLEQEKAKRKSAKF